MKRGVLPLQIIFIIMLGSAPVWAAAPNHSASLYGSLGLNTVPSARMDSPGTVRTTITTIDPYLHAGIHAQIAAPLTLSLRQSAEISNINADPDRLYPGVDLKIRLATENAWRPEIALGLLSAFGHKRMSSEYLAASKRYENFDFTAGIGWGRLGSAGHFKNPLAILSSHFDHSRDLDGENPAAPHDWFTGPDIGLFGGIEYFTPLDGLSIKADWNADRFKAERAAFAYDTPAPWSIGASYSPRPWLNLHTALIGGDKLMGGISLQTPVQKWIGRSYKTEEAPPLYAHRTDIALPGEALTGAQSEGLHLYDLRHNDHTSWVKMDMIPAYKPLPLQAGRAARHIANHAGTTTEAILITPTLYGLQGPSLHLIRSDLERAMAHGQGSPAEIWQSATLNAPPPDDLTPGYTKLYQTADRAGPRWHFRFVLDNEISLSEEDSGLLYRTSLIAEEQLHATPHSVSGLSFRLNLKDNLDQISSLRPTYILPIRSNVQDFAKKTVSLDRLYQSWLYTLKPDLHVAGSLGYLEEMYAGAHGEILYRPFGKTFALGATTALVGKRSTISTLNMGMTGDYSLTGHVNGWYEFPENDLTLHGKIGRYLNGDVGGTLSLSKDLDNGAQIEAFATATDQADYDLFGDTTHIYSGLKLSLPLGQFKYMPERSAARFTFAPQGRDTGQVLDAPLKLYDLTTPLSYRHIARHWHGIVE